VIEQNGGRGYAAPTPNELGKGQEEGEMRCDDAMRSWETILLVIIFNVLRSGE
jgi:hypothetical protein